MGDDYLASALLHENSDLRKKITNIEEENMKLAHIVNENTNNTKFLFYYLLRNIFLAIFTMRM